MSGPLAAARQARPGSRARRRLASLLTVMALLVVGCTGPGASPTPPAELVLMTHDSFAISEEVLDEFEQANGVQLRVLRAGDAGAMVNQAILAREAPLADVLFGVDNTFLSRALAANIFEPYRSPLLEHVPDALELDPDARVTPIDYGDVCINYDRAAFSAELPPPQSLEELADPRYDGMLVVQNPATSSPGLAFLLATIARFGEGVGERGGWQGFWRALRANDVLVTAGWEDAYFGAFSGGGGEGERPLVVSYATSPAAEALSTAAPLDEAPTGVVSDGCFRQIEFAGVLKGARAPELARAFIDFMLSPTFQEDIPLNMFVFPANRQAELPEVFVAHAEQIEEPLTMEPTEIDALRERAIREWNDVVLR
ncbi:MAG: thiamine ABC transporter substrate-binding protein [Chloroflexota bacterium]|nr:thiamine ABC transporter substrate-binding protein [Chloroflexota bacterium]